MDTRQQKTARDEHHLFASIERTIAGVACDVDLLAERGMITPEEADAFETCIEDLWISLSHLRRSLIRGGEGPRTSESLSEHIVSVIRMLRNDIVVARERMQW